MPKVKTTTKVTATKIINGERYYVFGPPFKSLKKAKDLKPIIQLGVGYDRRQKVHIMKISGTKNSWVIYRRNA